MWTDNHHNHHQLGRTIFGTPSSPLPTYLHGWLVGWFASNSEASGLGRTPGSLNAIILESRFRKRADAYSVPTT